MCPSTASALKIEGIQFRCKQVMTPFILAMIQIMTASTTAVVENIVETLCPVFCFHPDEPNTTRSLLDKAILYHHDVDHNTITYSLPTRGRITISYDATEHEMTHISVSSHTPVPVNSANCTQTGRLLVHVSKETHKFHIDNRKQYGKLWRPLKFLSIPQGKMFISVHPSPVMIADVDHTVRATQRRNAAMVEGNLRNQNCVLQQWQATQFYSPSDSDV